MRRRSVQMAEKKIVRRGTGPFAISANDLLSGHVVWLREGGEGLEWVANFDQARILATEAEAGAAMAQATADRRELDVVEAHVVDVTARPSGGPVPVTYRERVRAFGPTIGIDGQPTPPHP